MSSFEQETGSTVDRQPVGEREQQMPGVVAGDAPEDERALQHRDLAKVAVQPVEDGGVLGVGHLPGAEAGLAQAQHGDAELLDHRVVAVDELLQLAVDVAFELAGVDAVGGGDGVDGEVVPLGHRVRRGVQGPAGPSRRPARPSRSGG